MDSDEAAPDDEAALPDEAFFPDERRAAENRPDEDTVLLAPRRDFTPGGTPRGEGGEADIESPFADPAKPADAEWVSPAPKADDAPIGWPARPAPENPIIALRPPARTESKVDPGVRMKPQAAPVAPTPIEKPPTHVSDSSPPPPSSPPLSAATPALIKPRPVRPAWLQSSKMTPSDSFPAPASPMRFGRPRDDDDTVVKTLDKAPSDPARDRDAPRLPVASRFDMSPTSPPEMPLDDDMPPPRRRPVGSLQPASHDPAADGPPPPARTARLGGATAKAWRSLLAGLPVAWAMYSRGCLSAQDHLTRLVTRLAGQALGHGRWLASLSGTTLLWLGEFGARGLGAAAARSRQGARAAARLSRDLAIKVGDVSETVLLQIGGSLVSLGKAALPVPTSALASTRQRMIAFRQRRKEAAKAVAPSIGGTCSPAPARPEPPQAAAAPMVAAKPAAKTDKEPPPAAAPTTDERPGLLAAFRPARLALGGLAAASTAFLFLAFGPNPTPRSATAALTFPLPEKPGGQLDRSPQKAAAETAQDITTAAAVVLLELPEPLDEMIAYVEARGSAAAAGDKAFLTGAGAVENVGQFLQAAEVVGLERLLEPGEDYTFLVPNDAAFARFEPGEIDNLLDPAGHERLLILLSHHILPERLTFDDLAGGVREYTSLAGEAVTIDATDVVRIGDASMVDADLPTEHGILHVIDQVLAVDAP
ncbi:MAG: fasciclin domain-containing protein [Geminicoccaceae bacterium]